MDQLLQHINQELLKDKDTFIEIPLMELLGHWNIHNAQDIDITKKLLSFSKSADLRYISVMLTNGASIIRFWRDNTKELPKGGSDEQNSNQ